MSSFLTVCFPVSFYLYLFKRNQNTFGVISSPKKWTYLDSFVLQVKRLCVTVCPFPHSTTRSREEPRVCWHQVSLVSLKTCLFGKNISGIDGNNYRAQHEGLFCPQGRSLPNSTCPAAEYNEVHIISDRHQFSDSKPKCIFFYP